MKLIEEKCTVTLALLTAILIASHGFSGGSLMTLLGTYSYWIVRVGLQSFIFFGTRAVLERYGPGSLSLISLTLISIALSHPLYVLAITAMDISMGFPELGLEGATTGAGSRISELALEMLYLLDNHIALCLILSLPRWLLLQKKDSTVLEKDNGQSTLLSAIQPKLQGEVLWVEAQEHYVRITTTLEKRMILARFSDIVRELDSRNGLQTHRSHWVAREAIVECQKDGQSLKLVLTTGDTVPVSRTFKSQLENQQPS